MAEYTFEILFQQDIASITRNHKYIEYIKNNTGKTKTFICYKTYETKNVNENFDVIIYILNHHDVNFLH